MSISQTILASHLKPFLLYLRDQETNPSAILSSADLDPHQFNCPKQRLSHQKIHEMFKAAMAITGDGHLGLHIGEYYSVDSMNVIGQIVMNCRTAREVHEKIVRYGDILRNGDGSIITETDTGLAVIEYTTDYPHASTLAQVVECMISAWISVMTKLTGAPIRPVEICFRHQAPEDIREHERIFSAPVRFGQTWNAAVIESAYLDIPIPYPNPELLEILEAYAGKVLTRIRDDKPFTKETSRFITSSLPSAIPKIEAAATHFYMSLRSFQRALEKEETTYRKLVDQVIRSLAASYLSRESVSIGEIAFLLGFSDVSTFHRSFKRMTGHTPAQYRTGNRAPMA